MQSHDELSKYNRAKLDCIRDIRQQFLDDDFSVVRFWHDRKKQFPTLFCVIMRIYTTPISSAASERVDSLLKMLVNDKRSCLNASLLDDLIVLRSLHDKF